MTMTPGIMAAQPAETPKGPLNVQVGETTGKQAMQFQPANAGAVGGVVGYFDGGGAGGMTTGGPQSAGTGTTGWTTGPGLFSVYTINGLPMAWPGAFAYFRRVLADPTVRYVRALAVSPILATEWDWVCDKDAPSEAEEMLRKMFDPLRLQFLDDAVRAIDYGYTPFEGVYQMYRGMFWPRRMKALLHDLTAIWTTTHGEFVTLANGGDLLDAAKALIVTYDGEGGNLYGRGRCLNLLKVLPWWEDANEGAARYDRKIAGVFMVVHYPPGESFDRDGVKKPNWQIAQELLDKVSSGCPIAVCNEFAGQMMDDMLSKNVNADRTRWRFELLEDKGSRQPGFNERLQYLDKLKARGYNVPERAAFEAQKSGSRADSESHGDLITIQADIMSLRVCNAISGLPTDPHSPVNNVLRMNWGDEAMGTVRCIPRALPEDKKKFFREIAREAYLASPQAGNKLSPLSKIFDQAGLPLPEETVDEEEITEVFDDMAVKSVPNARGVPGSKSGEHAATTLSRIHERLRTRLSREPGK